jgi:hypothetical protein
LAPDAGVAKAALQEATVTPQPDRHGRVVLFPVLRVTSSVQNRIRDAAGRLLLLRHARYGDQVASRLPTGTAKRPYQADT